MRAKLENIMKAGNDEQPSHQEEETPDLGPCASVPRHKHVTALEIRQANKAWEAFQYRDIGYRSTFTPTRFEIWFEGRTERSKLIVEGRNLHGIYVLAVQGRLEWIKAADRDFAEDGKPIVLKVEVVTEPVKD